MTAEVKAGDTVMVTENGRSAYEATVIKVARVWITVKTEYRELRFRLDDQSDGNDIGWPARFYTLGQWADKRRDDAARDFLREQGIEVHWRSPWNKRRTELANIIRTAIEKEAQTCTAVNSDPS